jgi:hypothetical protein
MASDTPGKPKRNGSVPKLVRRLLIFAACGFGVILVVLAILIVPDQVRRVPEPKIDLRRLSAADTIDEAIPAPSVETAPVSSASAVDAETSRPSPAFDSGRGIDPVLYEALRARLHPIPNPSRLPEETRSIAEEWNRAMDDVTSALLAIDAASARIDWDEAVADLFRLEHREGNVMATYAEQLGWDSEDLLTLARDERPSESRRDGLLAQAWECGQTWDDVSAAVRARIAAEKGMWEDAAGGCAMLAGVPEPDKKSAWWEAEVYYWRKAGIKGRAILAVHSAMPAIVPVARVFDDTIGKPRERRRIQRNVDEQKRLVEEARLEEAKQRRR